MASAARRPVISLTRMRYGLFSDVHGNLPALLAILDALSRLDIDAYVCAGDVVGYGPHPAACVAAVESLRPAWVLGNHELLLLGRLPMEAAPPLVRNSIEWTRSVLPAETLRRLDRLPLTASLAGGVIVAHGSLSDASVRITRHPQMAAELDKLNRAHPQASVLVLGHTHRVVVADRERQVRWTGWRSRVQLRSDRRYLVNPGSVGQARGCVGHARAAVLDTDARTLQLLALRYEKASLEKDLAAAGLPTWSHHRSPLRRTRERIERKARSLFSGPGARNR